MLSNAKVQGLNETINKVLEYKGVVKGETSTRRAIIDPIISYLGYDVCNPFEVVNEYTCDFGIKKGEKVDYALYHNGELTILIEAKAVDVELDISHVGQLYRYFSVSKAQLGILTNGVEYWFFTDTKDKNIMDSEPFFKVSLEDLKEGELERLWLFNKADYNIGAIKSIFQNINIELQVGEYLDSQIKCVDMDFVRFIKGKLGIEINEEDFSKVVQLVLKNKLLGEQNTTPTPINRVVNSPVVATPNTSYVANNGVVAGYNGGLLPNVSKQGKKGSVLLNEITSLDCTGCKITKLVVGNSEYPVKSWADAIYTLVNHVSVGVSNIDWIDALDGTLSENKGFIRRDCSKFLKCAPIGSTGLYLETHGSSYTHVQRMRTVCRNANIEANGVLVEMD
jgi:hypothetical protein